MPRKSAADSAFPSSSTARLKPPDDVTGAAREVWLATVVACRSDHFHAADAPTLAAYCRAVVRERLASAALEAEGQIVEGKPNAWLTALARATRDLTVTSRLLRLNPVARQAAPSEPEVPIPYFERRELETEQHDEPS